MLTRMAVVLCCSASALGAGAASAIASPPVVVSIEREGPEHNKADHQQWTIHFDQAVYGLDANNVQVKRYPDGFGQPTDVNFADGNAFVGVGVGTPAGTGTLAVHLINVGNIQNAAHEHMTGGDMGAEVGYDVDRTGPATTIYGDPLTGGVTGASPVRFLLDIDETPIQGLTGASVALSGTAGATTAAIVPDGGGDPRDRVLEVSGMTGPGSVVVALPVGAFADELGNPSQAATFVAGANTAQYTGAGAPQGAGDPQPVAPLPIGPVGPVSPSPSPSPAPPPAPKPAAPKVVVGAAKLKLSSKGRVSVPVTCAADGPSCTAAVTVSAGAGRRRHALCAGTAKVATGRSVAVAAPCGARGRREIRGAGRKGLKVTVAVTVTDATGHQATATRATTARR
jgi:hypothetical protein